MRSLSSGSSSGYASATSTHDIDTVPAPVTTQTTTYTSIGAPNFYPINCIQRLDHGQPYQSEQDCLPSMNDFQFASSVDVQHNNGAWPILNVPEWGQHMTTAVGAPQY